MDWRKYEIRQALLSKEVRDFTQDAYDYIWPRHTLFAPGVAEKFAEELDLRNSSRDKKQVSNFTEDIGRAIRVSQFLLRDHFIHLFLFTLSEKDSFKKEVMLMCSHWLDNRNNIFVKVIDTFAIIAEAFLFYDYHRTTKRLYLSESTDWFTAFFEKKLAMEFFKNGGWKKLSETAFTCYDDLFDVLEKIVEIKYSTDHLGRVGLYYQHEVVEFLRRSPVKFPVPYIAGNKDYLDSKDTDRLHTTVYFRLELEYQAKKLSEEEAGKIATRPPDEAKLEVQLKSEEMIAKPKSKDLIPKGSCPVGQELQKDKVKKGSVQFVSKRHSSIDSKPQISTRSNPRRKFKSNKS